jgi:cobalamin biosynthesis protein CobD/CbiB
MFEPHQPNPGWPTIAAGIVLGIAMAFMVAYGMAAQP